MTRRIGILMCAIGVLTVSGCAGTGEMIPLHLHPVLPGSDKVVKSGGGPRVAVVSFEDGRTHKTGLGVRSHLWGGVSYFDIPESKPAETVAQTLADYLTAKGWHVLKRGSSERADVVLTGKILELFVHAKSRVGFTEITTKTKLAIQASNSADGSLIRMTLNGAGSEDVFWFEPEDVEAVVNDVLTDSFSKLVQDTKVEGNMLRLTGP